MVKYSQIPRITLLLKCLNVSVLRFCLIKLFPLFSIIFIALSYESPFRAFYFFPFSLFCENCQKSLRKPPKASQAVFAGFSQQSLRDFYGIFRSEAENLLKTAEKLKSSRLWRDFFSRNHVPFRGLQKQKASQAVFGGASWPLKLRVCPRA